MARRVYRDTQARMIAGVCSGLGEYFDADPTLVRLAFVVLSFFHGLGILLYLILWVITPVHMGIEGKQGQGVRQ